MTSDVRQPDAGDRLRAALEALLMVSERPATAVDLAVTLDTPVDRVQVALRGLADAYDDEGRGFELREIAGGWQLYARPEYDTLIASHLAQAAPGRLSQAALETLAVIAYRQPISRGQISAIRAVNVDSVVRTLESRGLVHAGSTDEETGALLYETTELLLQKLGIRDLGELPPISPLLPDAEEALEHDE